MNQKKIKKRISDKRVLEERYGVKVKEVDFTNPLKVKRGETAIGIMKCLIVSDKDFIKYFREIPLLVQTELLGFLWFRGSPVLPESVYDREIERDKRIKRFYEQQEEDKNSLDKDK